MASRAPAFDIRPHLPPKSPLDLVKDYTQAALAKQKRDAELAAAQRIGGVNDYVPHPKQVEFHTSKTTGTVFVAGNRLGKTVAGAAELVWRHMGTHPFRKLHKKIMPPVMTWAVSQELPGSNNLPHVQAEAVKAMAPPGALRGGQWAAAYSPGTRTLHWANGGVTVFKSYDQDLLAFEGAAVAGIWLDEEPTKKEIYTSCLMRLTDKGGHWWMTFTPVLSLQGKSWVRDDIWEKRSELSDMVTFVQASIFDNPHIPHDEVRKILAGMTDEERAVRAEGAFATLSGRVLSEFRPERHLIEPYFPTKEDRISLIIDPGITSPTAATWTALSPEGVGRVFMEHYERNLIPRQHMAVFHAQWQAIGCPEPVDVRMDPSAFNRTGSTTGSKLPASAHEYRLAAEEMGATWFHPLKALNDDPGALRVKRAFAQDRLLICRHLKWLLWEIERWTYRRPYGGKKGQEQSPPETPIDINDHAIDTLRYLLNCGMVPIEEYVEEPYDPLKAYWAKARTDAAGGDESAEYV